MQFGKRFVRAARLLVGALGRDRVVGIGNRDNPRAIGNLFAAQAIGIPGAVVKLVVMAHHQPNQVHRFERLQNLRAQQRVGLHRFPFFGIERAGLVQDNFRDSHFTDVVEQAGQANFLHLFLVQVQRLRDHHRVGRNFLRMSLGVVILSVNRQRQRGDGIHHGRRNFVAGPTLALLGERAGELFQPAVNFFEGFRPGRE